MASVNVNSLGDGVSYEVIVSGLRDGLQGQLVAQAVRNSRHANSIVRTQSYGNELIFAVRGEEASKKIKKKIKDALNDM